MKTFAMSMYASKEDLLEAKCKHYETQAMVLAKFAVEEMIGMGDLKVADAALKELGFVYGLSEDTYYQLQENEDA
jgi:hypothetical protein